MQKSSIIQKRVVCLAVLLAGGCGMTRALPERVLRDRVVADIAGEPVTLRQVLVRASLAAGREVGPAEEEPVRAALEEEISHRIILREISQNPGYADEKPDIATVGAALERRCGGADGLRRLMDSLQLSETDLERILVQQAQVISFVRIHFSPFVFVSVEEARQYYTDVFVPRLGPGAVPPPFEAVQDKISEIVEQQKINAEFDSWLERQRQQLRVKILY
jgi:hypothetical protein